LTRVDGRDARVCDRGWLVIILYLYSNHGESSIPGFAVSTGLTHDIQSTNCRKRLIRDFKRLSTDPPSGISGSPCPDNIMLWNAVIFGPRKLPWRKVTGQKHTDPVTGLYS